MESFKLKQLKFEDYLSFIRDSDADNLTVYQLNQILSIHGFAKLNQTKEYIVNAVSLLDLIPPTRSTIHANTGMAQLSSCHMSPLHLMELKQDIRDIEWQECPIGSVVTVNCVALCTSDDSISQDGTGVDMVRKRIERDEERDKMSFLRVPKPAMEGEEDTVVKVKPEMEKATHVASMTLKDADGYSWKNSGSNVLKRFPFYRFAFDLLIL
ncbi:hypothetical protein FCM35_KLT15641 [Carex littledalei]|uniref:DUF7787 domain-containing protein n=1 Tax=Carex littledalei TaxID=544730 RepID=A0A833VS94_9POAL|nr:hypothetical protein FCM35_KLT15641 [Carex littledalei]